MVTTRRQLVHKPRARLPPRHCLSTTARPSCACHLHHFVGREPVDPVSFDVRGFMRALSLYVLLTTVLLSPSLGAQTLALTEPEALARLDPNSPHVQALRAGVDIARAAQLAAGRWPNPRVTFNRESVAGATENMVLVAQPLPITGRRGLDVEAAAARVAAVGARADDLTRRLRADLRLAFAAVWLAQTRERELARAYMSEVQAAGHRAGAARSRWRRRRVRSPPSRTRGVRPRGRTRAGRHRAQRGRRRRWLGLFPSPVAPGTR